jgi:hypothetical protein
MGDMSDAARKVFPMESVLALVTGRDDPAVAELAGFLAGRSLCRCSAALAAPMAAGWLASLYPDFIGLEHDESLPWPAFVNTMKARMGDSVSVPPMNGRVASLVGKVLDAAAGKDETIRAQAAEMAALQTRVAELEPLQARNEEQEKKIAQLEAKVKSLTADVGALRKEAIPFQGKTPVDQQGLENLIRDAIVKNLKGFVAGAAAGAVAGEAVAEEAAAPESGEVPSDFGFGSSGADGDGFGF